MSTIATLILLPLGSATTGCSKGDGDFEETRATDPTIPCDGAASQSTISAGHTHELCVPASDLASPPPNGAGYETAASDGHTHLLFVGAPGLDAIRRGLVVRLTSSTTDDHSHEYSLVRAPD